MVCEIVYIICNISGCNMQNLWHVKVKPSSVVLLDQHCLVGITEVRHSKRAGKVLEITWKSTCRTLLLATSSVTVKTVKVNTGSVSWPRSLCIFSLPGYLWYFSEQESTLIAKTCVLAWYAQFVKAKIFSVQMCAQPTAQGHMSKQGKSMRSLIEKVRKRLPVASFK